MQKALRALCLIPFFCNSLFPMEHTSGGTVRREYPIKTERLSPAEKELLKAARDYPESNLKTLLLETETNINIIDRRGTSLLLQILLSTSRRVNAINKLQRNPSISLDSQPLALHAKLVTMLARTERLVSIILGRSCLTVNRPNDERRMPLFVATITNCTPLITLLHDNGARTWKELFGEQIPDPVDSYLVGMGNTESPSPVEVLGSNTASRTATPNPFEQPLDSGELAMLQRRMPELFQHLVDSFPKNVSEQPKDLTDDEPRIDIQMPD